MKATIDCQPAAPPPSDDPMLVAAALEGSRTAFGSLYRRHAAWLLPLVWRMTGGDRGRAEELAQDAFVQAWSRLDQLNDPARFGGWLKTLAIRLVLADRRKLSVTTSDQCPTLQADIEPPWPAADLDLERAVANLPERARQVLVLFCLEGFSHEEIASVMGIETGTSKAQLHRARTLLKETLA